VTYVYTCLFFPFVVFNIIMTLLTLYISNLRNSIIGSFSFFINALAMLIGTFISGSVFLGEVMGLGSKGRFGKVGGVRKIKVWYIPLFLLRTVLFSLCLQLNTTFSSEGYIQYSAPVLIAAYLFLLVCLRPYESNKLSNISVIFNELSVLFSLGLPLMPKFMTVSSDT